MALALTLTANAQQPQEAEQPQNANDGAARLASIISTPQSEWLGSFDAIDINGPMQVTLIRISENEGPKIIFDTKGSTTTKFKAEVDKNRVLEVVETIDAKRTTITEVKIYHQDISSLSVTGADVTVEQPFEDKMLDVQIAGGATLRAKVNLLDLDMMVTGRSSVVLEGSARYLDLQISTAQFDAAALQTMSTIVDASHGAEVSLNVSERLDAATATSAKITYSGNPTLIRVRNSLFGGEIVSAEK